MGESYKRRELHSYILHALQSLGGIASRKEIMKEIANDDGNDINVQVLESKDPSHNLFYLDFRMGIINLRTCGLIENYQRNSEIILTEKGIGADYALFPSEEDQALMNKYWKEHHSTHSGNPEISIDENEKIVLTELQIKLAEQLLISIKKKESYVTYSELAARVSPPIHHRNVGKNIGQVSILCHELGLPLISAKVINKNTATAGEGFYPLYKMLGIPTEGKTEKELYNAERKAIRECQEWYRLEDYLGLKIGLPRPAAGKDKELDRKYGEFYFWTILNDTVALKKGDKSFFEHHGMAIPMEIKWFFSADGLAYGKELFVSLFYEGTTFPGRIEVDALGRSRLFWHSDLSKIFQSHYHEESDYYPVIRFEKTDRNEYSIEFIDDEIIDTESLEPLETEVIPQTEGKRKEFYITKYERNPINRKNAIRIHGTRCMICGFDFEKFYGEAGRSVIEVHHVKPLSEVGEEIKINPETDLVCLCSNCHRIVHKKKNGVYTIDEVREMIKSNKHGE